MWVHIHNDEANLAFYNFTKATNNAALSGKCQEVYKGRGTVSGPGVGALYLTLGPGLSDILFNTLQSCPLQRSTGCELFAINFKLHTVHRSKY